MKIQRIQSAILFALFFAPNLWAAESACGSYSFVTEAKFQNNLESMISDTQDMEKFLLERSVHHTPEEISEYHFSNNKNGIVKIQAVCNTLTIYMLNGSLAEEMILGKFKTEVDKFATAMSAMTGTKKIIEKKALVKVGILDSFYGDQDEYEFIHKNSEAHEKKHRSAEETFLLHSHILHINIDKAGFDEVSRLSGLLKKSGLICEEEEQSLINAFFEKE